MTWDDGTPRSTNNAFAIIYKPQGVAGTHTAPKKRGPKPSAKHRTITALETFAERKERREAEILKKNLPFHIPNQADADKTRRILRVNV
jgi:hypothetical protein